MRKEEGSGWKGKERDRMGEERKIGERRERKQREKREGSGKKGKETGRMREERKEGGRKGKGKRQYERLEEGRRRKYASVWGGSTH